MDAGLGAECAALDHMALVARNGKFVELLGRKIPADSGQILQAEFVRAMGIVPKTRFFHAKPPPRHRLDRKPITWRLVNAHKAGPGPAKAGTYNGDLSPCQGAVAPQG